VSGIPTQFPLHVFESLKTSLACVDSCNILFEKYCIVGSNEMKLTYLLREECSII